MENITLFQSTVKMPLMKLPVCSVLVKANQGNILISPGSALDLEKIKSMENIKAIVAPNLWHSAGVPKAASYFPQAQLWGVEGLEKKRPDIQWTHFFPQSLWPYSDELVPIFIDGMPKVNEVLFFHKKSKSLIVCDLCFNIQNSQGLGSWLVLNMFGTYQKLAVSKFFLKFIKDKVALQKSLTQLFSYDFENIIPSHGEVVQGQGKNILLKAFAERDLRPL